MESIFSMTNKSVHVTINDGMHVWLIELLPFHIQSHESSNRLLPNTDIEFSLDHQTKKKQNNYFRLRSCICRTDIFSL